MPDTPYYTPKRPKSKYHLLTVLAILAAIWAVGLLVYTTRDTVYAEMNSLKLIPTPEALTELYFNNYSALPKATVAGQPLTFSFTVHNLQGVTTDYLYTVYYLSPTGTRTPVQSGVIALGNDEARLISVSYTFQKSNLPGRMIVELPQLNQKIDFILNGTVSQ